MIAIHYQEGNNFSEGWKKYCESNNIPFKLVSCYSNNIMDQLRDCSILMWNVNNFNYKDQILAKYLIRSLKKRDIKVFPDDNTVWHYDDKLAQKYLLEAVDAPIVETFVFYDRDSALEWIENTTFPKVFKLRKGSGSRNVVLVKSKKAARKLAKKAFKSGFPALDMMTILNYRYKKYKIGQESLFGLLKGVVRLFIGVPFKNMTSKEIGYLYFQEFLPNNTYDQRIIVIGNKAFALKRMVRENDFRASGSGMFYYDKENFDIECIRISFEVNKKLNFQCMAYDYVYDQNNNPKIVEVSFAFNPKVYLDCPGYWDDNLNWHDGPVLFEEWMVQEVLKEKKDVEIS